MPYKARVSRIFLKKEERLPRDVKSRVVETLREILVNPHVGVPLVGPLKGLWRVRIGKYRVLYERARAHSQGQDMRQVIIQVNIGHRYSFS